MEGFEERAASKREAAVTGLSIETPQVQGALMLFRWTQENGQESASIDLTDPESVDDRIAEEARDLWIAEENKEQSLAKKYRLYADKNPHVRVDVADREGLRALLGAITAETVH